MEITKFHIAILIGVCIVFLIAVFDILAMNSGLFGSRKDYIRGNFDIEWWRLFFKMNLAVISVAPVCYYFLYRRDLSETLAIFLTPIILWFTGLSDVLFFWFQFQNVPAVLPWLNQHFIIGTIAGFLGYPQVTATSLFISAFIGVILTGGTVALLKEVF